MGAISINVFENSSIGISEKIIDNTISDIFSVNFSWRVYGEKGMHNFSVEVDKSDLLVETNEDNNKEIIEIEITDNPMVSENEKEKYEMSILLIVAIFVIIALVFVIYIFILNTSNRNGLD